MTDDDDDDDDDGDDGGDDDDDDDDDDNDDDDDDGDGDGDNDDGDGDDDTVQLETMRRSSVYQDYLRPAKVDSLIQKYAYNLTVGDQVSGGSKYYVQSIACICSLSF